MSHGREARAAELGGEYQDPGRGAGLFRKMADGAPDKGLTGGGGGTLDLSRGWRTRGSGRRMRASGLSQDFGRGAAVIRYGDAESEYRDKARGAAPGRCRGLPGCGAASSLSCGWAEKRFSGKELRTPYNSGVFWHLCNSGGTG